MNWKDFFGPVLYDQLRRFAAARHMTFASVIRAAVAEYVK